MKKKLSELRRDIVSGDWVVVATGRAKRPEQFIIKQKKRKIGPINKCPFENPQETGNAHSLLIYKKGGHEHPTGDEDWFVQVVSNKYPAFASSGGTCPQIQNEGIYEWMDGVGSHEVVITRDHEKNIGRMTSQDVYFVLRAYLERFLSLKKEPCSKYISIFHNHGPSAGASIAHPHSQIIAIPVIPPDVYNSLRGSKKYFHDNGKCVHCVIIEHEMAEKKRIVYENDRFVVFCPFVSRTAFEMRIFPKHHQAYFDEIEEIGLRDLGDALRSAMAKVNIGLKDPDYNFFIHTAPVEDGHFDHYHWHFEILPKSSIWAGFELGTGIEISTISPEDAAKFFRGVKA